MQRIKKKAKQKIKRKSDVSSKKLLFDAKDKKILTEKVCMLLSFYILFK